MKNKRAYISVFNKEGIVRLASRLAASDWEIVSTGKTCALLQSEGIPAIESSAITGFTELLGGKVKSLHPMIFAPILADANEQKTLSSPPFSLVVVNLYPFASYQGQGAPLATLLANIDIGGVSLIRAAAKNFANVAVVCDPADYGLDFDNLSVQDKQRLALKAFAATSAYDFTILQELSQNFHLSLPENSDNTINQIPLASPKSLRYGENPHQTATLYHSPFFPSVDYKILGGKEMSYNNMVDASAAIDLLAEFCNTDSAAAVIVKHTNPCAVALGKTALDAWEKAYGADTQSPFGGIVAFNSAIDEELARRLASMFLEIIIAPSYTSQALAILHTKKNLRVIELNTPLASLKSLCQKEIKSTDFGVLIQGKDALSVDESSLSSPTSQKPAKTQIRDMLFAFKVAKHLKSNAIVIAEGERTLGLCAGQTSRIASVDIAIARAQRLTLDLSKAVLASDGFFPATDNIESIAKAGIKAIIEPFGSIKDNEVVATANTYGVSMLSASVRHFKH